MDRSQVQTRDNEAETVLVTGANGFVGLNLVQQLALRGFQVLATSRRAPDALGAVPEGATVEWILCDVTDRDGLTDLVQSRGVTRIVHAAAVTPTQHIEQNDPARVMDVNLGGTVNALEAARLGRVRRFLFVSSTVLYRDFPADRGCAREEETSPPTNLYGLCKEACERLCLQYSRDCGLSAISARLGTAYGPWERASHSRSRLSSIAQLVTWALENPNKLLRAHGLEIERDYIYVVDACSALAELALLPKPSWNIYNLSSDIAYPLLEVLKGLEDCVPGFCWQRTECAEEADFSFAAPDTRPPLDMNRLHTDLPELEFSSLRASIKDYVSWYQGVQA